MYSGTWREAKLLRHSLDGWPRYAGCVLYRTNIDNFASVHAFFRVGLVEDLPFPQKQGRPPMGSHASQSRDIRWRRLYEAAVLEVDLKILPRRVRIAKKAIHSQIVKLHKVDEAGDIWALMDALNVLDDLLRINQADLPRRA
jgi:hypothetical protein